MSGFAIADIVEILECNNNAVISQVLDVVISDPNCLQDKSVITTTSSLLTVPELTSKVVDVFTVISGEYPECLDEETTKKIFTESIRLCFNPKTASCRNSIFGLLCNMTLSEASSELFLNLNEEPQSGTDDESVQSVGGTWRDAIEEYLNYNPQAEMATEGAAVDWDKVDRSQHVGSVLCNLCRVSSARRSLLQQSKGYIPRLLLQVRSANPTRKRGCVATLRTLMFDPANHWWLAVDLRVMRYLLYPLVVGTPFTEKERVGMEAVLWMRADALAAVRPSSASEEGEGPTLGQEGTMVTSVPVGEEPEPVGEPVLSPDEVTLAVLVLECVLLLCQTRIVREQLRKQQVYCDVEVNNDSVSNITNEIVQLLMREESYDDLQVAPGDAQDTPGGGMESRVEELTEDSNELTDGVD